MGLWMIQFPKHNQLMGIMVLSNMEVAINKPLEELNTKQKKAIKHTHTPLLIVAGPGTGKTRVIIEKVIYLVEEKNIDPNRILVSTFTIKAANELKERLRKRLGDDVEGMQISTIHAFCKKMLEMFPEHLSYGNLFEVMDELDQFIFVNKNIWNFGLKDYIKEIKVDSLINFYNRATENDVDPDKLIEKLKHINATKMEKDIAQSYQIYFAHLTNPINTKLDFALLQREFFHLLVDHPEVLEKIRGMYDYILIDEYQDTNPIQDAIFRMIAEPNYNVTAVGDEDQSIYGFRGASLENFRSFLKRYPEADKKILNKNYRSSVEIVHTFDTYMKPYRTFDKEIVAVKDNFCNPIVLTSGSFKKEGETIVDFIEKLVKHHDVKYGDIAILFKSVKNHSKHIVKTFKELGIPHVVYGDSALLSQKNVLDMLFLLGLVNEYEFNEYDKKKKFKGNILRSEILNLEEHSIEKLDGINQYCLFGQINDIKLKQFGICDKDISKLIDLKNLKKSLKRNNISLLKQFYKILDITGFHGKLFENFNDEKELELRKLALLSKLINKFVENTGSREFSTFLYHINTIPEKKMEDTPQIDDKDVVKMMTIHQAKGLEFPVVILGGITEKRYNFSEGEDHLIDIPKELMLDKTNFDGDAELRRALYVGMSRAKKLLAFSTIHGKRSKPPEFIDNISRKTDVETLDKNLDEHYEAPKEKKRLTYSSINTYLSCPFWFYLRDLINFEIPIAYFQKYGIIVHSCLRKIHIEIKAGKQLSIKDIVKIVDTYCKDDDSKNKWRNELITDLWRYYQDTSNFIGEVVDVELPFSCIVQDIVTTGTVDLVIKNKNDEYEIIDYKARRKEGINKLNVDIQLRMYNLALNEKYDKPIEKISGYTIKDNEQTFFSNCEKDINGTKQLLQNISESMEAKKFERNWGSQFCETSTGKCDFYYLCKRLEE